MANSKKWFSVHSFGKALSKILDDKISVMGSGSTDAGVHAREQSAHFKSKKKII